MIKEAYEEGQYRAQEELAKLAGDRETAAGSAAILGPLAGLLAKDGRGWQTAGGALGGGILGSALGAAPGALLKNKKAMMIGQALGNLTGNVGGAYAAHGK